MNASDVELVVDGNLLAKIAAMPAEGAELTDAELAAVVGGMGGGGRSRPPMTLLPGRFPRPRPRPPVMRGRL